MNYENDNIATITATIRYDDYTEMTVSGGAASTQVEIA
jgi:hypothetical protein